MVTTQEHKGMVFEGCGKGKAKFYVYTKFCKGCGLCLIKCPINKKGDICLKWSKEVGIYATPAVEPTPDKCIACGTCEMVCPDSAIRIDRV